MESHAIWVACQQEKQLSARGCVMVLRIPRQGSSSSRHKSEAKTNQKINNSESGNAEVAAALNILSRKDGICYLSINWLVIELNA